MVRILARLRGAATARITQEPQELLRAIEHLRKSDEFLLQDDLPNSLLALISAENSLAALGTTEVHPAKDLLPRRELLVHRGQILSSQCRKLLRESDTTENLLAIGWRTILVVLLFISLILVAAIIPHRLADGRIDMVRVQVYWSRASGGMREQWSMYAPVLLDGQWQEIRIPAADPLTAVRIDPATNATVLEYFDVRNARVVWEDPDDGFEPTLKQVNWRGTNCQASSIGDHVHITDMQPDCNITSMNFPDYYKVSEIIFEARGISRVLPPWVWLYWKLNWQAINE